jgi:iron complex transport system ATP-binding protein
VTLTLDNVGASYRGQPVLHGINLVCTRGTVTAVLGPNGAGKSTLLKAIAGLVPATGRIDRDAGRVTHLPQDSSVRVSLTALETVLLGRIGTLGFRVPEADITAAIAALSLVGIAMLAERHLDELSGGQRQLVFLAQALAGEPDILLLDEPTSTLDLRNQITMPSLIRELTGHRCLVTLVVLHDLNPASRFADRLVLLDGGIVREAGTAHEVLRVELIESVYGIAAWVETGPDNRPTVTAYAASAQPGPKNGARIERR